MRLCAPLIALAVAGGFFFGAPSAVGAQVGESSALSEERATQRARASFVQGQAAAAEGRWPAAAEAFQVAFELSGNAAALYNLGFALRALGRYRGARDAFRLLLDEHQEFDPALLEEARGFLEEAEGQLAVLSVEGLPDQDVELRFDGRFRPDDGERPIVIEADPGAHTLSVRAGSGVPFLWEGVLDAGEQRSVEVRLDVSDDDSDGDDEPSIAESPWFWTAIVGVVALGAGAGVAYHSLSGQLEPDTDRVVEL